MLCIIESSVKRKTNSYLDNFMPNSNAPETSFPSPRKKLKVTNIPNNPQAQGQGKSISKFICISLLFYF